MVPIIPISCQFDQQTISKIIAADALVQRYRALFALLDWSPLDSPEPATGPGRPAHPKSAFANYAPLIPVCWPISLRKPSRLCFRKFRA